MRFRAARAEEAAGNLDAADQGYARILDVAPAARGRASHCAPAAALAALASTSNGW